ncbi:MAG TPA: hypothetical protein VFW62_10685, partial [bacterium]|nr:hypothetical protein [bacterium]
MRGSSWKTWAYCFAAAGFKVWLAAPQAISLGTKNSLQWLYLLVAQELSQGHWLGSSPRLALRFPPGYSFWLSLNHLADIPLRLGMEALLILAAIAFLLALRRLRVPEAVSCLLFTLIVFDPATLTLFQKVSPQTLTWPLLLLAASGYFLSTYAEKTSSKTLLGLLAGLSLAAYWLSQSSAWVPCLLLGWMILWELGLQPPGHSWGRRLGWILPVLGLLLGPTLILDLSIRTLNQI